MVPRGSRAWVFHDETGHQKFLCERCARLRNGIIDEEMVEAFKDWLAVNGGGTFKRQVSAAGKSSTALLEAWATGPVVVLLTVLGLAILWTVLTLIFGLIFPN
jgi:hypothetical protein